MSEQIQTSMVALLRALAPEEGYNLTALEQVRILRSDRPLTRTPVLYDPGIVIVCQGVSAVIWAIGFMSMMPSITLRFQCRCPL